MVYIKRLLLMMVVMEIMLSFAHSAIAELSQVKVGDTIVTVNFVSHTEANAAAGGNLDCKNLAIGSGKHVCCWGYAAAAYKKIWGKSFTRAQNNNMLRNIDYLERKMTEDNLRKFFAQAAPGAMFRITRSAQDAQNPTGSDSYSGHSMVFLKVHSSGNGAYFYNGNGYNSNGEVKIDYFTWTRLAKYIPNAYIKYIMWPGAAAYAEDYTMVDSTERIGVSVKIASGEDQCFIKSTPFEDGKTVDVIEKGDVINIVGAIENKYGNTWYKTTEGNFVYSGDITVYAVDWTQLFPIRAHFIYDKAVNSHILPYADSPNAGKISKGQAIATQRFVINKHGNIWAQLEDNSYVCFHDIVKNETYMTFYSHSIMPTHSTTYPEGNITVSSSQGFWLKGEVTSQVPFLYLSTRIVNRETGEDVAEAGSPAKIYPTTDIRKFDIYETKVNGKSLDSQTLFRNLTEGWYRYELNVQFGFKYEGKTFVFGQEMNLLKSNFIVNNPSGEEPPLCDIIEGFTGDASGDGWVDLNDAFVIFRHCAGEDVSIQVSNADVNSDQAVDLYDALSILQHEAGWGVALQ